LIGLQKNEAATRTIERCPARPTTGAPRVEVRLEGETVWLNQNQITELFLTTKQNIGQHIRNVFAEGGLASESVVNPSSPNIPKQEIVDAIAAVTAFLDLVAKK